MKRRLVPLFWIAALVVLAAAAVPWFERSQVWVPSRAIEATPADVGVPFEEVVLRAEDGASILAWWMPGPNPAAPVILFCHGNGGNISHRVASYQQWRRLGFGALAFDYRGYGQSHGRLSEAGTYLDADAAYLHVRDVRGIPPDRIAVIGRSLGGAVAVELATRQPARCLVLESTFRSVPAMGREVYPFLPTSLGRVRYDSEARIGSVACPVLVMHGRWDEVIPYTHGRAVYEAAGPPKAWHDLQGGHNEGRYLTDPAYEQALQSFLLHPGPGAAPPPLDR